jgi:ATP-dependent protease ClpP protease subunit
MPDHVIELSGTIVPDNWIWPEDRGLFSSAMLADALAAAGAETDVTVKLNSGGGVADEGEAARVMLVGHKGKVTVHITGNAHSAASLMAMGADEIVMSMGSLMLIHDPSAGYFGTSDQLAHASAEMDATAYAYAGVYAERAGIELDDARAIMKQEITYSAPNAVEAGFADRVADDLAPVMSAQTQAEMGALAHAAIMSANDQASKAFAKFMAAENAATDRAAKPTQTGQAAQPKTMKGPTMTKEQLAALAALTKPLLAHVDQAEIDAAIDGLEFDAAKAKLTEMSAQHIPATPAPAPSAPTAPVMTAADVASAIAADRQRGATIRANAAAAVTAGYMSTADVDAMVNGDTTVEDANAKIVAMMTANAPTASGRIEITRDAGETQINGMIGALMHRVDPAQALEGPAEQYRGMRIKQMALTLGGNAHGFDDQANVRAGMRSQAIMNGGGMGVSDFAYITGEVLNRTLANRYSHRAPTYRRISRQRTASDFRTLHSVTWGADLSFKPVQESGEYLASQIDDQAGKLKVAKYGRRAILTFEAVINDDMGIFDDLPREFARHGANLESTLAWDIIRTNAKTPDNKAMFHADHKNTAGAAAISVASVGAGRKLMWEQRAFGAKDADDFIEVEPDLLIVPPALETAAMQFVATSVPTKAADTNPWAATLTPMVEARLGTVAKGGDDAKWYLAASDMPPLEHAFLEGYAAPTVSIVNGTNPDDVDMVARHFFAAAAAEFRGIFRNG